MPQIPIYKIRPLEAVKPALCFHYSSYVSFLSQALREANHRLPRGNRSCGFRNGVAQALVLKPY